MDLSNIFAALTIVFLFPMLTFAQTDSLRFLALGDSYTIGESVEETCRWPVQLTDSLQKRGIAISEPKILAQTGWTTEELQQAIDSTELQPTYDMVSLLIGVNDQYRGYDPEKYPSNFRSLLEEAIVLAGGQTDGVFVVSIPNYGVTPFAQDRNPKKIRKEIKEYNRMAKSIADSMNVIFIDITPISEKASEVEDLTASDKLHPSGKMYTLWMEKIISELDELIARLTR